MVCSPWLLSTHPCDSVRGLITGSISDSQQWASGIATPSSLTRVSSQDLVLGRDCRCPRKYLFGTLTFRSLAVAARGGRGGRGAGAVRMSNTPAQPRSVASEDGDVEKTTKTVNVVIKGKVQGVYYRNWTVDTAQQLGVHGWVRNLKDGSVEAVLSGKSAAVDSLIEKCRSGPVAARVSSVEVSPGKDEVPQGFERKPTVCHCYHKRTLRQQKMTVTERRWQLPNGYFISLHVLWFSKCCRRKSIHWNDIKSLLLVFLCARRRSEIGHVDFLETSATETS